MSFLNRRVWLYMVTAIVLLAVTEFAQAADTTGGFHVLNGIDSTFQPYQHSWAKTIMPFAYRLFWLLVTIDFSWTAVIWALEKNDFTEIIIGIVKKFMTNGFFFTLLKLSSEWIPAIISSFSMIGKNAAGLTDAQATPDGVIGVGFKSALSIFDVIGSMSLTQKIALALPMEFLGIVIFFCFLYIGIQLLVLLVESYIVIGGGVILLGFGGSRWTTDFATKYLQYAVSVGMRLMVLYLVIGVGSTISANLVSVISKDDVIASMFQAVGVALAYAFIVFKVDNIASGMMSGASSSSAGDMMSSALTAGAAIAGGAAMMQGAGKAASGLASAASSRLDEALGAGANAFQDVGGGGGAPNSMTGGGSTNSSATPPAPSNAGSTFNTTSASSSPPESNSSSPTSASASSSSAAPAPGSSSSNGTPAPSNSGGSSNSPGSGSKAVSDSSSQQSATPAMEAASQSGTSASSGNASLNADTAATSAVSSSTPSQSSSSTQSPGDATTASIGGSGNNASPPADKPKPPAQDPLHKRIQDLQGYLPQGSSASTAAPQINLGHTQD